MAADTITKVYSNEGTLVPKFSLTPDIGIAALDVSFIDEQFTGGNNIKKAYITVDGNSIRKVYR